MVKYGVIKTEDFDLSNYDECVQDSFNDIVQDSTDYKMLFAFSSHITDFTFDYIFDSKANYETWLENGINTTITKVTYDWENELCYITIADTNFPGAYEFECTKEWTAAECQAAIDNKFNTREDV